MARALRNLAARLLRSGGSAGEAERYLMEAEATWDVLGGPTRTDVGMSALDLGEARTLLGRHVGAVEAYARALQI